MGRKPLNKARRKDPATRRQWINKLSPYFLSGQLSNSTILEIADILSISKATLYKHFSSKKEILEMVVSLKIEDILQYSLLLKDVSLPFKKRLNDALELALNALAGISNSFLLDLKTWHPHLWKLIEQLQNQVVLDLEAFYKEGKEKGIINDLEPRLLSIIDLIFIEKFSDPQFLIDHQIDLQGALSGFFKLKREGIFKSDNYHE